MYVFPAASDSGIAQRLDADHAGYATLKGKRTYAVNSSLIL